MESITASTGAIAFGFDRASSVYVLRLPRGSDGTAEARASMSAAGVKGIAELSVFTADDVDALRTDISARSWSPDAQKYFYLFYYDPVSDLMALESDAPESSIAPLLAKDGQSLEYSWSKGGRSSRTSEGDPHHGGASIQVVRTATTDHCTSGFSVQNSSGTRYMMTAGHCFQDQDVVTMSGGGQVVGRAQNRIGYPTFDMRLIGAHSYSRDIYTGGSSGSPTIPVISADNPTVGGSYCESGAVTFEHCGLVVDSMTAQLCDVDGCTPGLAAYTFPSGSSPMGGDSGMPFYAKFSTPSAKIRGLFIGNSSDHGVAEPWNTVSSHLGVSIVTT